MVFKMILEDAKLQINDVFVVNADEYFGLKSGRYKICSFTKNRLGAPMYRVKHDRRNASTVYNLYVKDLDKDVYEPKIEDLTSGVGVAFLNFKSVVKYDKELIAQAKKYNSKK